MVLLVNKRFLSLVASFRLSPPCVILHSTSSPLLGDEGPPSSRTGGRFIFAVDVFVAFFVFYEKGLLTLCPTDLSRLLRHARYGYSGPILCSPVSWTGPREPHG